MNLPAPDAVREGMSATGPAGALLVIDVEIGRPIATGPAVLTTSRAVASEKGRFATASWSWDGAPAKRLRGALGSPAWMPSSTPRCGPARARTCSSTKTCA